jgi:hypothetical protein
MGVSVRRQAGKRQPERRLGSEEINPTGVEVWSEESETGLKSGLPPLLASDHYFDRSATTISGG